MSPSTHQSIPQMLLLFMLCMVASGASTTEKIDQEQLVPDAGIKCGSCPCVNPCAQLVPPPPPPPPPPSPPPPKSTTYCPPLAPPPPRFVYVTGEPGTVYETDPYDWFYNSAGQNFVHWLLILVGMVILNIFL
ncbi:hypothetical protein Tsubulata_003703 [Turnera subulata]|uniref:Uncharacterized protein n=1 Tax=Turnera subulata TaxID=218843 RepID=A0A9Q0GFX7_9ROSI|nr:hypothetical protein Tsubulata_003703 [Turnera subulata]